jgi:hypothetical protein
LTVVGYFKDTCVPSGFPNEIQYLLAVMLGVERFRRSIDDLVRLYRVASFSGEATHADASTLSLWIEAA